MVEINTTELVSWLESEIKELMKTAKKNREAGNGDQYYQSLKTLDYLISIKNRT